MKSIPVIPASECLMILAAAIAGCHTGSDSALNRSLVGAPTDGTGEAIGCPADSTPLLLTVYFDYDSSLLRHDALATLSENAATLRATPGATIQIAGHCDERGTQDYNFALGEMRALAVREHLVKLGVERTRLITISYGEENPAVLGQNETAWAQNRRCEFTNAF